MNIPSFTEDHISQIPALQLLQTLGYTYLTQEEALAQRGGKTTQVLLEGILREQLGRINAPRVSSTRTAAFTPASITAGIEALREVPLQEGYIHACAYVHSLLRWGKAVEQAVEGNRKSLTLRYIDWEHPENNAFHVAEEFSVMRSGSHAHFRPDLVLFVNGIPLCIIECKRPDSKDPLTQAISQHLRYQHEDGIRPLYVYAQCLLAVATNTARYGTNGTPEPFWAHWEEKFTSQAEALAWQETLADLRNTPLRPEQKDKLFSGRYRYVRRYFGALEQEPVLPAEQDAFLYGLCRPDRLLDLTNRYILFDNGEKKIARYQQYFAIRKAMDRLRPLTGGKRRGGYIWHTQGSGKSLTMVMLAQSIAREITSPKIILVTDRTDLDRQITETFVKCGMEVENATSGQSLAALLKSPKALVITTVINKFESALRKTTPIHDPDIFVLVDEGHRSQHGIFNLEMQKTLPEACFIARATALELWECFRGEYLL